MKLFLTTRNVSINKYATEHIFLLLSLIFRKFSNSELILFVFVGQASRFDFIEAFDRSFTTTDTTFQWSWVCIPWKTRNCLLSFLWTFFAFRLRKVTVRAQVTGLNPVVPVPSFMGLCPIAIKTKSHRFEIIVFALSLQLGLNPIAII